MRRKTRVVMDLPTGAIFSWNNDLYKIVKQADDSSNPTIVVRIAGLWSSEVNGWLDQDTWLAVKTKSGKLLTENFNSGCEVNVDLSMNPLRKEISMGISHPNCDVGAEMDTFRDVISQFESVIPIDRHDDQTNVTTLEYVQAEGEPPYIRYRLTLEAVAVVTPTEYMNLKEEVAAKKDKAAVAE